MGENIRCSTDGKNPEMTVGIDLGDRFSRYCVVNQDGEVIEEGRIQTTMAALERHFTGERQRIAMECGTHSQWVSRLLQGMGHELLVANARKVRAITESESKNDRNDAEKLARSRPTMCGCCRRFTYCAACTSNRRVVFQLEDVAQDYLRWAPRRRYPGRLRTNEC